jgi:hypothetical protein
VVLAHLKAQQTRGDEAGRLAWKLRLVKGLYGRGWGREDVRQLFRVIDWMLDLPDVLTQAFKQELHQFEQEKQMPFITSVERVAREEGREEGRREELLAGLEVALELKFGAAGLALLPEIKQIAQVDRLKAIQQALRSAATPDELRRLWA